MIISAISSYRISFSELMSWFIKKWPENSKTIWGITIMKHRADSTGDKR